jgi:hypothetical protein
MEKLIQSEKFTTVEQLADHLLSLITVYGPSLASAAVDVSAPDDRSTGGLPYATSLEVYQESLSDSCIVYNLRIVLGEA